MVSALLSRIGALRFNPPRELTIKLRRLVYEKGIEMTSRPETSSLDELVADPAKAATLPPGTGSVDWARLHSPGLASTSTRGITQ